MENFPAVIVSCLFKIKEWNTFLQNRRVLGQDEAVVAIGNATVIVANSKYVGLCPDPASFSDLLKQDPKLFFERVVADLSMRFHDTVVFVHALRIEVDGEKIENKTVPGFVDETTSHVIIKGKISPLIDYVREVCEPNFSVTHDGKLANISILTKH